MGRAQHKDDLIKSSQQNFSKMIQLIESMTDDDLHQPFDFSNRKDKEAHWKRDKNVRDVIVHLYEWHILQIEWIENNLNHINKNFLPEPYNWRSYGELNRKFWEKHQHTSLESALSMLKSSHQEMIELASSFTNEELFTQESFPWTHGSKLGSYFVSTMASHYEWAIKKIKIHKSNLQKSIS